MQQTNQQQEEQQHKIWTKKKREEAEDTVESLLEVDFGGSDWEDGEEGEDGGAEAASLRHWRRRPYTLTPLFCCCVGES